MPVRTVIEHGPKDKRSVAFSLDWPGWSRGAKTGEAAFETLEAYRERYRPIARLAGMIGEFDAAGPLEVVEERVGTGSTDFWGISFSPSSFERDDPIDEARLERGITILRACWAIFDDVAARVSEEMRPGPRGGGRNRNRIVRHTIRTESEDFARQVGVRIEEEAALSPEGLRTHRRDFVAGMRAYNTGEVQKRMRSWTLPFLIRHAAFHTLDHAWEMEDKDLTGEPTADRLVKGSVSASNHVTPKAGKSAKRTAAQGGVLTTLPASMTGRASPAKAAVGDKPVFAYISSLPQPQRAIAERVDALAARTLPGLQRSVKWGMAWYGVGDGWCFACGGFAGHVKLTFGRGTSLTPIPPVAPIGMGKDSRGVDLGSVDDIDERQLASWMEQAAAIPGFGKR